jgi:hypothetical protein
MASASLNLCIIARCQTKIPIRAKMAGLAHRHRPIQMGLVFLVTTTTSRTVAVLRPLLEIVISPHFLFEVQVSDRMIEPMPVSMRF